jgi:hypothetical protein
MTDEAWPDDYVDPLQQEFEELITETVARVRNGEVAIEIAVAEAADSEFARMYEMSPGFIGHHVSCGLGASDPQAFTAARR